MADLTAELTALEQRRLDALSGFDAATIDALFLDDMLYVHTGGRIEPKADVLKRLREGTGARLVYKPEPISVREFGGFALFSGLVGMEVTPPGGETRVMKTYLTRGVRRDGDAWRYFLVQATLA